MGIASGDALGYGLECLEFVFAKKPELVLLHVSSPIVRPRQIISAIHDALPDTVILAVTDKSANHSWEKLVAAGADASIEELGGDLELARGVAFSVTLLDRRRRGEYAVQPGGNVLAIIGADGGIGKTTVATNLAIGLQRETLGSVVLVDADPRFGDVAIALDIQGHRTLGEAAANLAQPEPQEIGRFLATTYGISVLGGPASAAAFKLVTADDLTAILGILRKEFDFVIVDTSGAWTELSTAAVDAANTTLLVTTPGLREVQRAARTLAMLRERMGESVATVRIVMNRKGMPGQLDAESCTRELGREPTWSVPQDVHLKMAMQSGVPAVESFPRSVGALEIVKIAKSIAHNEWKLGTGTKRLPHAVGAMKSQTV
jgi:pilus assembly protein CpaE